MTVPQRTRWKLEPGSNYELTLMDRGRRYQATVKLRAWDDLDGQECGQFSHPRSLEAVDYTGLSDYVPDQPLICTFTSPSMDICEGRLRSLGNEGLEFALWGAGAIKEGQLKVGAPTFNAKADPNMLGAYRGWLRDTILTQQRKDFERFDVHGFLANRRSASARVPGQAEVRLLSDKDPLVLVIGEGGFTQRIRETLGRKFGIAELDYIKGDVRPLLGALGGDAPDRGRTRLLLINQRLRLSSGLELTRQLTQGEACPLPILMAGTEEDAALKRNRAIAAGAVDFIAVEPFKILAVMRAMEETLSLFR
jgi:CheY-like chemotaxis protein